MRPTITLLTLFLGLGGPVFGQPTFDGDFADETLRIDYFHTGQSGQEILSLDQVYRSPGWAGSRINLIDTLNLGKYLAMVFDASTNRLLFSRGFSSIFGEWETTQEARDGVARTFHESVLLPCPRAPIQLVISKRDRWMRFQPVFTTHIDPDSRFVNREIRHAGQNVLTLHESGPAHAKVDFLLLGDGYTEADMPKFRRDAQRWTDVMLNTAPFSDMADRINIRAVEVVSADSGIDEPRKNVWKRNALGASYNSLDLERYVLTLENEAVRDAASAAPYDFLYILVNSDRYGGGGIYNLYATGMTGVENAEQDWHVDYMFTHEFGHSFAGLGDEYYSSTTAYVDFYPAGAEPWEPNVTALQDPGSLKWSDLLGPDTPLPTPWPKAAYDSLDALRLTFDRSAPDYAEKRAAVRDLQLELMENARYSDRVGAFEGAGYSATGLYRPELDCRMFSLSLAPFDRVCSRAVARVIRFYAP